jgi:uncharacterized protein YbbK (DUF523 family)
MTAASSDVLDDAGRRPIRVGISACLMGDDVRFDGGHKRDAFLTETLGRFVEWVRSVRKSSAVSARRASPCGSCASRTACACSPPRAALTSRPQMVHFSRSRVSALVGEDLSDFVLKKDSPSCGPERVKIYDRHGTPARGGRGLFAAPFEACMMPAHGWIFSCLSSIPMNCSIRRARVSAFFAV